MANFKSGQLADVLIVGAGLGGSTLAYRLARAGLRVMVIDRGHFLRPSDRLPGEPIGVHFATFPGSLIGGMTKFYGAAMYRMRQSDFQATQRESGESPAWPIGYWDLERYYAEAELLYHVHGASDGDPTEPPRSSSFPFPPIPHAAPVAVLVDRLTASGTSVSAIPRALDYGEGGKCILCATCDSYYCRLDAKMDAEIAALRPALATRNVGLLSRAQCLYVLLNEDESTATGVMIRREGQLQMIHAKLVVLCAGVPGSAQLLFSSRSRRHPHGLGNSTGCLGRYLGGHTTGVFFPLLSTIRKLPPLHTKTFSINGYYEGACDWPYPIGTIQAAGQVPFWESPTLRKGIRYVARLVGERSIYMLFMTEAIPTRDSGFEFCENSVSKFTPPLENTETFKKLRGIAIGAFRKAGYRVIPHQPRRLGHLVGTVRFGADPNSSVLDVNCRVRGVQNLYVVDASVLPSAGAVNTGLTIAALALRLGDTIARSSEGWL